jgi:hypothetical protein
VRGKQGLFSGLLGLHGWERLNGAIAQRLSGAPRCFSGIKSAEYCGEWEKDKRLKEKIVVPVVQRGKVGNLPK